MTETGWQPIETAPKDLNDVLLWNGKIAFQGWHNEDGWHHIGNADHDDYPEDPQPTHWQPLPEGPK